MKKENLSLSMLIGLLLIIVLIGAVMLVSKNQETRREAFFAGTNVLIQPENISGNVGDEVPVALFIETQPVSGTTIPAKVDFVETKLCYTTGISPSSSTIADNISLDPGFSGILKAKVIASSDNYYNQCLVLAFNSDKDAGNLKSGMTRVATIKFKSNSPGAGKIDVMKSDTYISGYNPNNSSNDLAIQTSDVKGANFSFGGESIYPYLSFKMAFSGVSPEAKCAVNWPLQVTVLGNGMTKVFSNVIPVKETASVTIKGITMATYKVSMPLTGFTEKENLAVFVKGPKHIQMKYARNNQDSYYNQAGGEINLTTDTNNSTVYDFTKYPLLPGDITGASEGVQDGVIDGRDFSLVKTRAINRQSVADGGNLPADLDGNCLESAYDSTLFKMSLQEKLSQLY